MELLYYELYTCMDCYRDIRRKSIIITKTAQGWKEYRCLRCHRKYLIKRRKDKELQK